MLTSKVAWFLLGSAWRMGAFDSFWRWTLRLLVRALQFVLCLGSIILLSTGFAVGSFQGHSTMLGSRYVFVTFMLAFLGMVYALWWFMLIELFRLSPRPRFFYSALMDLVLALCLMVAAIVLLLSDFVHNCLSFGHFLRCTNLNAAVIVTFLAMGSFLLTPWLLYRWSRQDTQGQAHDGHPQPEPETPRDTYQPAATPVTTTHHGYKDTTTPEQRV